MRILLNGDSTETEARDVQGLVESLDTAGKGVAVAINGEVVPRSAWGERALRTDDRVEVLRAVGGG